MGSNPGEGRGATPMYGVYGYVPPSDSGTGYKNHPFSLEDGYILLY